MVEISSSVVISIYVSSSNMSQPSKKINGLFQEIKDYYKKIRIIETKNLSYRSQLIWNESDGSCYCGKGSSDKR